MLYSFCLESGCEDGFNIYAGVISDLQGNLYGTAPYSGASNAGAVFELSPPSSGSGPWTETILWSANGSSTGDSVYGPLVRDANGNLYGMTYYDGEYDAGTVFELSPPATNGGTWTEQTLYVFCQQSNCTDGKGGYGNALILDSKGNLYGTTYEGGGIQCGRGFQAQPARHERRRLDIPSAICFRRQRQ